MASIALKQKYYVHDICCSGIIFCFRVIPPIGVGVTWTYRNRTQPLNRKRQWESVSCSRPQSEKLDFRLDWLDFNHNNSFYTHLKIFFKKKKVKPGVVIQSSVARGHIISEYSCPGLFFFFFKSQCAGTNVSCDTNRVSEQDQQVAGSKTTVKTSRGSLNNGI